MKFNRHLQFGIAGIQFIVSAGWGVDTFCMFRLRLADLGGECPGFVNVFEIGVLFFYFYVGYMMLDEMSR